MYKVTLADLYVAYRKAKAEAFYENTHFHALAFTEYEQKLDENLRGLLTILLDDASPWSRLDIQGDYAYLPKSVDCEPWENGHEGHFRALNPLLDWQQRFQEKRIPAIAKLRLVIRPTVNFQIISALWIIKVGHKFDAVINTEVSHGNRLRRRSRKIDEKWSARGPLNMTAAGLFAPYFSAYRKWRETGLNRMEESLKQGKDILAITMDLEQFYHRVAPTFLLRKSFLQSIRLKLTTFERQFTTDLLDAIALWYEQTPDFKVRPQGALPVGLSASKIISNVLLANFDNAILQKIKPIYYGRYVDDIFLVFENTKLAVNAKEVTQRIAKAMHPMLTIPENQEGSPSIRLKIPYAMDSELIFAGTKQKIFSLSSPHGLDLIQHIREQIRIQSSEYRLLPVVPNTAVEMASRALLATPDASLQVDALRKADVVSVRRLGLSLLLRDIEAYSADLRPDSWHSIRAEFYGLVKRHVITPAGFFEFISYVPRVFGLMLSCGDTVEAEQLIFELNDVVNILRKTTTAGSEEQAKNFDLAVYQYALALQQAGYQAATERSVELDITYLRVLKKLSSLYPSIEIPRTTQAFKKVVHEILLSDWGRRPYKDYWYQTQEDDEIGPPVPDDVEIRRNLRLGGIRRFRKGFTDLKTPHWPALAFPTRPLRIDEIALVAPKVFESSYLFKLAVMSLRGAKVISKEELGIPPPSPIDIEEKLVRFSVPAPAKDMIRVAVTSFETSHEQWEAAAKGKQDRSVARYRNLNELINRILKEGKRPHYIILPELSIPLRWALRVARKLAMNDVSILAGVEYNKDRNTGRLRNDCLVSLVTNWPGYRGNIARLQPKFIPAHGERDALKKIRMNRKKLQLFEPKGMLAKPTVYSHGGFFFSILICSDLTNIEHRHQLRGEIDTLFALEWNSDLKTFSPLVEATANDLHAYVVQINNRSYGDSRIRSPSRIDHARDVVQVKGGASDYYVIGEIDYHALRLEQSSTKEKARFKPIPIGFKMSAPRIKDLKQKVASSKNEHKKIFKKM
ncbi:RNA-directed DNA polymerase [Herbaspirillum seropedicae]|uniref:Reverse transcriptase of bacterial retrotransposons protein n=1 Tax=Herbaspirillum seropedicae (strain SmR1) TaxID=757424 RepID=D8ITP5_HERSS|nr:RNA-directed DNA polymerase [Herbaspirillum seropedicae]ADJ61536.1 reverse transcriptase of bacterial retrotransposons protein [Herbaspirillum seropedicae SmR1]UMU19668.1 RNA-directed DNA polymerase [Herbaspirillum seropedicae]